MQWAPDSPDLWAPDSGRPNRWAPDTFEHLTLRRGVDLFLGAKAAEGASPKTITWYRMILMRAGAAFSADHAIDRLTGPDLRAWLVELRTTLAPVSVAGYVRALKVGRCSPHPRHTFARSYLVNGGDAFSLQQIRGHTTLDVVKPYVSLAAFEIVRRLHAVASPADRLLIGPKGFGNPAAGCLPPIERSGRGDDGDGRAARCHSGRASADVRGDPVTGIAVYHLHEGEEEGRRELECQARRCSSRRPARHRHVVLGPVWDQGCPSGLA
jgi:hypothetical protein